MRLKMMRRTKNTEFSGIGLEMKVGIELAEKVEREITKRGFRPEYASTNYVLAVIDKLEGEST